VRTRFEKTANAKALGDEFIRLYQFSIDLKKMRFPIEPRIELTDSTGEYWVCSSTPQNAVIIRLFSQGPSASEEISP
jgi:hypothetical protein